MFYQRQEDLEQDTLSYKTVTNYFVAHNNPIITSNSHHGFTLFFTALFTKCIQYQYPYLILILSISIRDGRHSMILVTLKGGTRAVNFSE